MTRDELDPFERPRAPYWWYFGQPWSAPICEIYDHGATPVGTICIHCGETIADGDRGLVQPFTDGDGVWPLPQHLECAVCSVARFRPCGRRHHIQP